MTDTTTTAKEQASAMEAQDMVIVEKDSTAAESGVDAQVQSPLFSKLPPELRNHVYELVMSPFQDMARCFDPASNEWRPEHQAAITIDLGLMGTCKRVYQESEFARTLALQNCDFYLRPSQPIAFVYVEKPAWHRPLPFYSVDNHLERIPDAQKAHIKSLLIQNVWVFDHSSPCESLYAFHNLQFGAIQPRHLTLIRAKRVLDVYKIRDFVAIMLRGGVGPPAVSSKKRRFKGLPNSLETITILHDVPLSGTRPLPEKLQLWEPILRDGTQLKFCERHDGKPWKWLNSDGGRGFEDYATTKLVWKR